MKGSTVSIFGSLRVGNPRWFVLERQKEIQSHKVFLLKPTINIERKIAM